MILFSKPNIGTEKILMYYGVQMMLQIMIKLTAAVKSADMFRFFEDRIRTQVLKLPTLVNFRCHFSGIPNRSRHCKDAS
jgi:hypothetical protein